MADVERYIRESDIHSTCTCAARTCGPHRCWPSRLGWTMAGSLALYLLVMHSYWAYERTTWTQAAVTQLMIEMDTTITEKFQTVTQSLQDQAIQRQANWTTWMLTQHQTWAAWMASCQQEWWTAFPPHTSR